MKDTVSWNAADIAGFKARYGRWPYEFVPEPKPVKRDEVSQIEAVQDDIDEDAAILDDANREMFGDETAELIELGILPDDIGCK